MIEYTISIKVDKFRKALYLCETGSVREWFTGVEGEIEQPNERMTRVGTPGDTK